MSGGGGSTSSVKPSAEEKRLIEQQTDALRQAQQYVQIALRQQQELTPQLFGALGFNVQMDPETGEITSFQQIPGGAFQQALQAPTGPTLPGLPTLPEQEELGDQKAPPRLAAFARQAEKLALQAAKGMANPAVERSIELGRQELAAQLQNSFGPDYALSTPSHRLLAEFEGAAAAARGNAFRQDLMSFGQLASGLRGDIANLKAAGYNLSAADRNRMIQEGQLGYNTALQHALMQGDIDTAAALQPFQVAQGTVGMLSGLANAPLAFAQPQASVAGQLSSPLSTLLAQRQLRSQAPTSGQLVGTGLTALGGAGLGAYLGAPLGPPGMLAGGAAGLGAGSVIGATFGSLF